MWDQIPSHPKSIMIGGRKKSWPKEAERAQKDRELNPAMLGPTHLFPRWTRERLGVLVVCYYRL